MPKLPTGEITMKPQPTHTPTRRKCDNCQLVEPHHSSGCPWGNKPYIFRAVNAHDELFGLLTEISLRIDEIKTNPNGLEDLLACNQDVKEVIAKAEGE